MDYGLSIHLLWRVHILWHIENVPNGLWTQYTSTMEGSYSMTHKKYHVDYGLRIHLLWRVHILWHIENVPNGLWTRGTFTMEGSYCKTYTKCTQWSMDLGYIYYGGFIFWHIKMYHMDYGLWVHLLWRVQILWHAENGPHKIWSWSPFSIGDILGYIFYET